MERTGARQATVRTLAVLAVAGAAWVGWYLGSPLFVNRVVNESLPAGLAPSEAAAGRVTAVEAAAGGVAPAGAAADAAVGDEAIEGEAAAADATAGGPAPAAGPRSGRFGVIDAVHRGEGSATLLALADGGHVLRLEDFRVTNGPDLYVYLSGHAAPRDSRQLHEGGALEVARLKGNVGSQNYELPADFDPAQFHSAVIYCKRFAVVFSTAELSAAAG
jgi:hypothetical protein